MIAMTAVAVSENDCAIEAVAGYRPPGTGSLVTDIRSEGFRVEKRSEAQSPG